MEYIGILIWSIVWGVVAQAVGKSKNVNGFWWGFFLGIIGLIIVLCIKGEPEVKTINVISENSVEKDNSKYDQLEKLANLKETGAISKEEFEKEKEKILHMK